jgi:putative ABC transport system permease protein
MAFLVLALVFSVSAGERKKEFGVYRLLGAKREWLGKLVTGEGIFLGLIGALSGIAIASLCVFPFNALIFGAVGLPSLPLSAGEVITRLLAASLFGALIAPLASFFAVLKLTKATVASNLRADE